MTPQDDFDAAAHAQFTYWRASRRLTLKLLLVWFLVTFAIVFFAQDLSGYTIFGWPLSFYLAAQGATLMYVVIVGFYAWRMRTLDRIVTGEDVHGH